MNTMLETLLKLEGLDVESISIARMKAIWRCIEDRKKVLVRIRFALVLIAVSAMLLGVIGYYRMIWHSL